ncbi:MAG TPA: entericidin EcnA/B family protein [Methylococcus sp.]|nr:entericidin EcnA/B family protein [Methylococcus sp.]
MKVLLSLCLALLLAGCNAWAGFGKDLQILGKKIENRAKESPSTSPS